MNFENKLIRLAFFTAFAVSVYELDTLIPKPLPFMRLGLANIVILLLLLANDLKSAIIVTFAKTIIGGFFSGALISPTTILSLSGGAFAILIMYLAMKSRIPFSVIGISICGAVAHNLTQIVLVRFILIKSSTIFYLTPILIIFGITTGIFTGYLTHLIQERFLQDGNEKRIKEFEGNI